MKNPFIWHHEVNRFPTRDELRAGAEVNDDGRITSEAISPLGVCLSAAIGLLGLILLILVITAGWKSFNRHQKVSDANNHVKIVKIKIKQARQQAEVVRANNHRVFEEGQQRIISAKALAESQRLIHATLTPLYVQLEAIKAQESIATSGKNNTVIYVPAGTNGTPIIAQDAKGAALTPGPQAGN